MSQKAQAESLHDQGVQLLEEAKRAALTKLGHSKEALQKFNAGEAEGQSREALMTTVHEAIDDAAKFKDQAKHLIDDLETYKAIDQFSSGHAAPIHPELSGVPAPTSTQLSAEEGASTWAPGRPSSELPILQGQARMKLNRYLRLMGRRVYNKFATEQVTQAEFEELASPVPERFMSPYIERDGGAVTAEEVRNEILRQIRDVTMIRSRARNIATDQASISFPSAKLNLALKKTRAGVGTGVAPVTVRDVFGKVRFVPSGTAEIVKIPKELLEDSTFDIIGFIAEEIANEDLETEENQFLNGDGSGEPLGVLASIAILDAAGYTGLLIPHTGASAALFKPEDIKTLPYKMRKAMRVGGAAGGAAWTVEREFLQKVTVMRTDSGAGAGTGEFLFQQGLRAGDPDTLVNYPILESEFYPDNITSGSVGDPMALFCQWGHYWIVDRKSMQISVLDQLYAETQEIGYQYEKRMDAAPVRAEAFIALARKA